MSEYSSGGLEAYNLAAFLVGPFDDPSRSMDADPEQANIHNWQIPYYQIALDALRKTAKAETVPDDWMPEPAEGAQLYRDMADVRKRHAMVGGLMHYIEDYKSGINETPLRPHQQEIFDSISDAVLRSSESDEAITIKSATGTGKTAVLVTLVEALKYKEHDNDTVRALVLVPTKDILSQTERAFEKFSDTVHPGVYFSEKKDIRDVTVMTYRSFDMAVRNGVVTDAMVDVIIKDEEHESYGEKTSESLEAFCAANDQRRHKLVFGLSATPRESENLAHESHLIEAIDRGILSPISVNGFKTGAKIEEQERFRKREDYAPEELAALIENDPRNQIILQEVVGGLAEGKRIIVRCLPGGKLLHPHLMSEKINRIMTTIEDPYTQVTSDRKIRSAVVDGDMPMKQRKILYDIFNNPLRDGADGIDVLLFVDTLIRGWDSPIAKKLINGCPSRSPTRMEQLLGRITRPFERMDGSSVYGEAVDLIDESKASQVLFKDIIEKYTDDKEYVPGAIVGPGLIDLRNGKEAFIDKPLDQIDTRSDPDQKTPIVASKRARRDKQITLESDVIRGVADSEKESPFDHPIVLTSSELVDYTKLDDLADELSVFDEDIEDAIMDRNFPVAIYIESDDTETTYVPNTVISRLKSYLRRT
ncbi:DEAD/DEAH box helicase [bacterium]|nr:MAG: DEAD/DEAH box helicase [bacterium]